MSPGVTPNSNPNPKNQVLNPIKGQAPGNTSPQKEPEFKRVDKCLWKHTKSGIYYGIAKTKGKQVKQSLKTTDHLTAKKKLKVFCEQVEHLEGVGVRRLKFHELAAKWLASVEGNQQPTTHRTTSNVVNTLNLYFGDMLARSITSREIDEWQQARSKAVTRLKTILSPRRFNYELQTLRLIFRYGRDTLHVLLNDPTTALKRRRLQTAEKDTPTRDEFRRIKEQLRKEPRSNGTGEAADLAEFLAYSGCRVGAIPGLKWQHVDFPKNKITLRNTKHRGGGRWYTVPMNPALKTFLIDLKRRSGDVQPADLVIKIKDAKKALQGACKRAGLKDFTHHSLRHFFASEAVEAGIDFKVVASWLDHSDGGFLVAKTYGHLREDHSARMAALMTFSTPPTDPGTVHVLPTREESGSV